MKPDRAWQQHALLRQLNPLHAFDQYSPSNYSSLPALAGTNTKYEDRLPSCFWKPPHPKEVTIFLPGGGLSVCGGWANFWGVVWGEHFFPRGQKGQNFFPKFFIFAPPAQSLTNYNFPSDPKEGGDIFWIGQQRSQTFLLHEKGGKNWWPVITDRRPPSGKKILGPQCQSWMFWLRGAYHNLITCSYVIYETQWYGRSQNQVKIFYIFIWFWLQSLHNVKVIHMRI